MYKELSYNRTQTFWQYIEVYSGVSTVDFPLTLYLQIRLQIKFVQSRKLKMLKLFCILIIIFVYELPSITTYIKLKVEDDGQET
jgi:hypothetical protein